MIIPQAPRDVKETKIFRRLLEKSNSEDGCAEKAEIFVRAATPLVDLIISGPFREFTLHNRDHSKKLLHIIDNVISDSVLDHLSVVEMLLLIMSSYLHDMGMSITSVERERIIASSDFYEHCRSWPELWGAIDSARSRLLAIEKGSSELFSVESEVYQLQEAAICSYLRPKHATAERYKELISTIKKETRRDDLFEVCGVSFEDIIIDVCVSHNEDVGVLIESKSPFDDRFPRDFPISGHFVNAQFCAALIRIADILDFDRERTPKILYESLGISERSLPGADVTLKEWEKHMSVHSIQIEDDEIIVSADSRHPVIERSVKDFCSIIENEIRNTQAIVKRNKIEISSKYYIDLPINVRPRIRSIGYSYKDMSFKLNQTAIISLLMGEKLYSNVAVPLRELIQNAIDACAARENLEDTRDYSPSINISLENDEFGRIWLSVIDNGVGMDEYVLNNYFLNIGSSYYDSAEFERIVKSKDRLGFVPISRFGIGIVSVFLVADILDVCTLSSNSPRKDFVARSLRIEKMGSLAFVKENISSPKGTKIRIRLRHEMSKDIDSFIHSAFSYLTSVLIRPKYDINIDFFGNKHVFSNKRRLIVKPSAAKILQEENLELVMLDLSRWSDLICGTVVFLFGKTQDEKISVHAGGRRLLFGNRGYEPNVFIENYIGNIVCVNGFRMLVKKGKMLGGQTAKLAMLYDIDVKGDKKIVYDVSRDRIIGEGKVELLKSFKSTVYKALDETGITNRLDDISKLIVESTFTYGSKYNDQRTVSDKLLEKVIPLLPNGKWPQGVHKDVAAELRISNRLASLAISKLLSTGVVSKPA